MAMLIIKLKNIPHKGNFNKNNRFLLCFLSLQTTFNFPTPKKGHATKSSYNHLNLRYTNEGNFKYCFTKNGFKLSCVGLEGDEGAGLTWRQTTEKRALKWRSVAKQKHRRVRGTVAKETSCCSGNATSGAVEVLFSYGYYLAFLVLKRGGEWGSFVLESAYLCWLKMYYMFVNNVFATNT